MKTPDNNNVIELGKTPASQALEFRENSKRRMRTFFTHEENGRFAKEYEATERICLVAAEELVDAEYSQILGSIPQNEGFMTARSIAISNQFQKLMMSRLDDYKSGKGVIPPSLDQQP